MLFTDIPEPEEPRAQVPDSWHCVQCGWFVYNVDPVTHSPIPGAPAPFDTVHGKLCSVCHEIMLSLLGNDYFKRQHDDWAKQVKHARDYNDK